MSNNLPFLNMDSNILWNPSDIAFLKSLLLNDISCIIPLTSSITSLDAFLAELATLSLSVLITSSLVINLPDS